MKLPIVSRLFQSRDGPNNSFLGSTYSFFFGSTTSGKTVNEITAMQITAVYACVRILSETIASLPLHTYKYTETGKEKAKEHPLYHLLADEPNPEMTSFVFRETLMGHLLLWGNTYAQIIRDGRGKVVALYPLLPNKMKVDRAGNGKIYYIYSRYSDENPNIKGYGDVYLQKHEVLHISGLGFDGLMGYSPIAMAKNAVGMAIATEEYGTKFFSNGANPGGVLEHPGVVKDPARVRESWNSVYQGSTNAHRVAVLEEGMKFQSIGIPPEQAQFLETRKFQTEEICRIFRVPPHIVASDDITPKQFKAELTASEGDISVWLNSPGGDVFTASQIYTMLKEYGGKITVKIDGIAASEASVIAMAGNEILMSPVAMMIVHNPATVIFGEASDLQNGIDMLSEVKESIVNTYEQKTSLSRTKISKMMDAETWFSAKKAVELGFADRGI
jgi:HK97 family phage portal protein